MNFTKKAPKKLTPLQAAAGELEAALEKYIARSAELCTDPTDCAWVLTDRWGSFRFYIAQRAAQIQNAIEGARQNGVR